MTNRTGATGTCPACGKQMYVSKKLAKRAARRVINRRGGHLNPYKCGRYWHIGHLPRSVIAGDLPRDQIRQRDDGLPA